MSLKRLLVIALALCLAVGFCACSDEAEAPLPDKQTDAQPSTVATTQPTTQPAVFDGYTVKVVDEGGNPIPNAMVQLCLDSCIPGITDASGIASFPTEEANYKVSFVSLPDGYAYSSAEQEFYFEDGAKELTIVLKAVA